MSGNVQGAIRPVIQIVKQGDVRVVKVLVPGPPGPPGPPGLGGEGYVFNQPTPSGSWTINHNLGYRPSVAVFDSGSQEIDAEVSHPSVNTVILTLNPPTAGFARLI
jgi:hypothetical protein